MGIYREVQNLLLAQKEFVDAHDEAQLTGCYWPEMVLETRFNAAPPQIIESRDAVLLHITAGWADANRPEIVHFVGPAAVEEHGADRVIAKSTCLFINGADGTVLGWGSYRDTLDRRNGVWKLSHRAVDSTFLPK